MATIVDFQNVSAAGLESSPVAEALAGLWANEARDYMNKCKHEFRATPAAESRDTLDYVNRVLKDERGIEFATQKSKLAGTVRGSFFVIKGEYPA